MLSAVLCVVGATLVIALLAPWQTTAQTLEGNVLPVKIVHNSCKDNCALGQFEALSSQTVHYLHDPLIRDWQSKCATFADLPSDLFVLHTSDGVNYQLDKGDPSTVARSMSAVARTFRNPGDATWPHCVSSILMLQSVPRV